MMKHPFLTFILVMGILIGGSLWFIQSPWFAKVVKVVAFQYIPKDIGIDGDFSELSIQLFPPAISINNPKIALRENNIAHLPAGSSVVAEKVSFSFLPFQIFSGDIRVHEVTVVNGDVQLFLNPSTLKKKPAHTPTQKMGIHWDELLQIRAEGFAFENVNFKVEIQDSRAVKKMVALQARALRLAQWSGKGGLGYSLELDLAQIQGDYLREFIPFDSIDQIEASAYLNAIGLQIENLKVSEAGSVADVTGAIKGNFLSPKSLSADLTLKANGELGRVLKAISSKGKPLPMDGDVNLTAKIQGDLTKPLETLKVDATVTTAHFAFQHWKADQVQAEAKWIASPQGGEVHLKKALIVAAEHARVGGKNPGGGGKIEIGPLKWTIGSKDPLVVPLNFERAHLHWLGAPGLKDVYPIDLRLNGKIDATVTLPRPSGPHSPGNDWEVKADLQAWVEKFQLDNQRYLQTKPLSIVFQVPKIQLTGPVVINSSGIFPGGLVLGLPHTQLKTHGKIDFKTGYDLFAEGPIHLEDLGQIAENPISGQGTIGVHVHGPSSQVLVDMDCNIKDITYFGLNYGNMTGRVTYDDDLYNLVFSGINLERGLTHYTMDGILDFNKEGTVDLKSRVVRGDIQDFIQILTKLTSPLDWFPHALRGSVTGDIHVSGGLGLNRLQVLSQINGTNWEYAGERFKTVHLEGGYDSGKYLISVFRATKHFGKILGHIASDPEQGLTWRFHTQDFSMADLDHIAPLDVPMRGRIDFQSNGKGKIGNLSSLTELDLSALTVRGVPMAPSRFSVKTSSGVAYLQGSLLGGQGILDCLYDFNPKSMSRVKVDLKQLDFSPGLLLLNNRAIQDKSLAGNLSGSLDLSFRAGELEHSNGSFSLSNYYLARSDTQFRLSKPLFAKITEGSFEIPSLELRGNSGSANLTLKSKTGKLEGKITGDLDTSILEFFVSSISQASGPVLLDFTVGGLLSSPTFEGLAQLTGSSIRVPSVDSPFENITGSIHLKQNILSFKNIRGDLGGGRVGADGQVLLYAEKFPTVDLKGTLTGPKVKIYPFQYAKLNGSLNVAGEGLPYLISGAVEVESAVWKEKVLNQSQKVSGGLKSVPYAPAAVKQGESGTSKFKLNIDVVAEKGVVVQNDLFQDTQVKARLTLVNTLDSPSVLGKANVVQGKLIFKDHVFQIQSANVLFDSPTIVNPSFDLNAFTEVNGIKIQLYSTGRLDKLKIDFTSNPSLQPSEILSLLTVGLTTADAKKLNSSDLSVVQQGEAASLVLHSLDFNRELEDKTGFHVQLNEAVNTQQGVSAFRPQSQSDTSAAPQITIRRKLGDRLSVSAGSTVGVGTNKTNQVNLDYSVNQDLSVTGVYNNYGTYGSVDSSSTIQNSLGVDLKFQKRFK